MVYHLTELIENLKESLKIEKDPEVKKHLISIITDTISKNYVNLSIEANNINRDNENSNYLDFLNNKEKEIMEKMEKIKVELEEREFSVIELESENVDFNKINENSDPVISIKQKEYVYLLDELRDTRYQIDVLKYPIYNKELHDKEIHMNKINALENELTEMKFYINNLHENINNNLFKKTENGLVNRLDELENNERDIFRHINEFKDNENYILGKIDQINELRCNLDDMEEKRDNLEERIYESFNKLENNYKLDELDEKLHEMGDTVYKLEMFNIEQMNNLDKVLSNNFKNKESIEKNEVRLNIIEKDINEINSDCDYNGYAPFSLLKSPLVSPIKAPNPTNMFRNNSPVNFSDSPVNFSDSLNPDQYVDEKIYTPVNTPNTYISETGCPYSPV